jgi:hypothetical protein
VLPGTLTTRFAYVSISRAAHDAQVYTNDVGSLSERLQHDVTKASAIEFGKVGSPSANAPIEQTALALKAFVMEVGS